MRSPPLRWYQFYTLLAVFDLLVIGGAIALHYSATNDFHALLDAFGRFDAAERWLASLRQSLIEVGAVAHEAVTNGDVAYARRQFVQLTNTLEQEKNRTEVPAREMKRFWEHVLAMNAAEERVFRGIEAPDRRSSLGDSLARDLAELSREKAHALRQLDREGARLLSEAASVQQGSQLLADRHEMAGRILAAVLVLNIAGMFWYRRKLLRTHEILTTEQERILAERRERLAAVGEICSGVAHGIQNPLASIHSSVELILDLGHTDAATRQRAQDILTECDRLSKRVKRLLSFTRAALTQMGRIDICQALNDSIAEFFARFEHGRVTLIRPPVNGLLVVEANPHELASVFIELLVNALDYAPRDSEIRITCRANQCNAQVEIADQ